MHNNMLFIRTILYYFRELQVIRPNYDPIINLLTHQSHLTFTHRPANIATKLTLRVSPSEEKLKARKNCPLLGHDVWPLYKNQKNALEGSGEICSFELHDQRGRRASVRGT